MANSSCIYCGGTGRTLDMELCSNCVEEGSSIKLNPMTTPKAYQNVTEFDSSFLPSFVGVNYKEFMQDLFKSIKTSCRLEYNLLLCSPSNSGKTVLAYSVYNLLFSKGIKYLPLMDIIEARDLLHGYTKENKENLILLEKSPIVFIIIPQDVPHRFIDTMSTIVQRRVRKGGGTVFLYGGNYKYLESVDTYGRLKLIEGDGSYSSIRIEKFGRNDFEKEGVI